MPDEPKTLFLGFERRVFDRLPVGGWERDEKRLDDIRNYLLFPFSIKDVRDDPVNQCDFNVIN